VEYLSIIEDYFLGKLKNEELENFYLELKKNPRLKDEFDAYRAAHNFIIYQEDSLVDDLEKMVDFEFDPEVYLDINKYRKTETNIDKEKLLSDSLKSITLETGANSLKQKLWNKRKVAAIITLVVLITIVCILLCSLSADDNELYLRYYSPYVASFDTRAIRQEENNLFTEAVTFYKAGNYELALARFELIPQPDKPLCLPLLKGICSMELRNYKRAIEQLDQIDEKSCIYKESLWYKGLCFLKIKDDENAKVVFNRLKSSKYYSKRSKLILKALN
jgi:hypothetical protein